MCCCDGLLLLAHIEAEKARQAEAARARAEEFPPFSGHECESAPAATRPIERDHSLIHTALALCARLYKREAGTLVSEAPFR